MFFLFRLFSSFTVSLPPLAARGSRCLIRSATFVVLVLQPLLLQHHHPDTIVLVCFKHLGLLLHDRPHRASLAPSSFDCTGFRAHEPAALHDNTVSTPSWCLICSLNSASFAAKFQTIPHPVFYASTTCVSVGFFMCASMPHKETTFFVVRVTSRRLPNVFTTISKVSRFKHLPTPPELRAVS